MKEIIQKVYEYSLEEIMEERFGRYAKTIIQDRAIPDARDGLKPVQRRILYGMYKDHNTYDKPYRKSAKTVGFIMGNYHPHGDSSIYDAMVRMSQWWKQNTPYIDMHGNNGSMDGDSPAAMRYTEARLSKISNELLKDLEKDLEMKYWAPNFDDTELEPTVLPAKFPNLLVNGSTGISAGYATNIPPHNLGEVIDATIKRIDSPNCRLETIMECMKGPDFPTGGIVEGKQGIIDAFTTGRGKVIVRSKIDYVEEKNKNQFVITEIPFEVNREALVRSINDIRIDKKIDGIQDVRNESDRDGLRIAIDLKKGANKDLVLNYLLKNTDLQISYNYNMVAIVNRRPMTIGVLPLLDAYIAHQKDVIIRRTKFDLKYAEDRMHILEGFVKMVSILDEVIKTIRKSKNKPDAEANLVKEFEFTESQAKAIVMLQLYRLTNTDVVAIQEELEKLKLIAQALREILNDEEKLKSRMKTELRQIKKEYAVDRKTVIKDEITEIKIEKEDMIVKEDCIVVTTHEGYVKRVSLRSYSSSEEETGLKEGDYPIGIYEMNTMNTVLLFTDQGNYLYVPVHELPDMKWKEMGKHISNIIKVSAGENIIGSIPVYDFKSTHEITMFTKNGMVKRTPLSEFEVTRYNKPMTCMKLKDKDLLLSVTMSDQKEVFIGTKNGYGLWYGIEDIPTSGLKSSGVKSISLKNDEVVSASLFDGSDEYVTVITDKGTAKRVKITEFDKTSRARRGLLLVREVKTNPYKIISTYIIPSKTLLGVKTDQNTEIVKPTDFPIVDRYSTGTSFIKGKLIETYIVKECEKKDQKEIVSEPVSKEVSLKEIDEKIMTIDDFLEDFEK